MKTAIITGGTKGIGLGVAESLLADGYNVAITSRSEESATEIQKSLENKLLPNLRLYATNFI